MTNYQKKMKCELLVETKMDVRLFSWVDSPILTCHHPSFRPRSLAAQNTDGVECGIGGDAVDLPSDGAGTVRAVSLAISICSLIT